MEIQPSSEILDEREGRMNATLSPEAAEPNNAVVAAADERLKHAYQQIASADDQLARLTRRLSDLEHEAAYQTSTVPGRRPSRGKPVLRAFTGLLLAACIVGAAFVLQSPSGDSAKLMIARWVPAVLATLVPLEKPGVPAPVGAVQLAAAEPTAVPASSRAPTAPQEVGPPAAPLSPELAQLLQTIKGDIADVEQKIEQLKAAQEQVASDNAKAIGELKASQEQTTLLITKISEQNSRPKASVAASVAAPVASARPVAIAPRLPTSTHASPQATRSPPQ